jgi:hypothetical protein
VIAASDDERRDLFLTTAQRLGTAVQNVEKDFWVCWTLDALFNGLAEDSPRLLFKGGTSLSKSFALIDRFSEDIDITVFRNDLGEGAAVQTLEALSGKKRRARLDAIKEACQAFIGGNLLRGPPRGRCCCDDSRQSPQRIAIASSWTPQTLTNKRCSSGTRLQRRQPTITCDRP